MACSKISNKLFERIEINGENGTLEWKTIAGLKD